MKPPYKTSINTWFTKQLFWDVWISLPSTERIFEKPIFTLYDDKPEYISARKTFVEMRDPTGYKWAMTYLGDYAHWQKLMTCVWFKEAYETWILEMNAMLQAESLKTLENLAKSETESIALTASKLLLERPWEKRKGAGRPSKAEVDANIKEAAKKRTAEDDDLERIGLRIIK